MNQIHEDDWGEESWSRHSGMFEPATWQDSEESSVDSFGIDETARQIVAISRENGYSSAEISELTGLTIEQIESI